LFIEILNNTTGYQAWKY